MVATSRIPAPMPIRIRARMTGTTTTTIRVVTKATIGPAATIRTTVIADDHATIITIEMTNADVMADAPTTAWIAWTVVECEAVIMVE